MSDTRTHVKGSLTFSLLWESVLLIKDFTDEKKIDTVLALKRLGIAGTFAVIGVLLPDILEPATSPHHRQFFHSLFLAGLLITFFVMLKKKTITIENDDVRRILNNLGIGYSVHMVQDAGTPKGLPVI